MTNFRLEPWDERGLTLERRANTAEMQAFLGGVRTEEAIAAQLGRFREVIDSGSGEMLLIVVDDAPEPVGSVGYWEKEWRGEKVFELGWKVLPGFQGRGLAVGATRAALSRAAADGRHRWAHAYPRVDHEASNAVCRKAGFDLLEEIDFEFPAGHPIRCNDWRFELR